MSAAANLLGLVRNHLEPLTDASARNFANSIEWDMTERQLEPATLPCLRHLDRAGEIAPMPERLLVAALAENRHALRWGQTYKVADFGRQFIVSYGWTELFGTRGHFVNDAMAGGFLVLGPRTFYPDHHHTAEELYIPLTPGAEWRKGEGPFVVRKAGEVIHHPSDVSHAMRTDGDPLVALYFWRGGPLDQKSVVTDRPPLEGRPGAEVEVS